MGKESRAMQDSLRIQREAGGLLRTFEKTVLAQRPLGDPEAGGLAAGGDLSAPDIQILLLKIRVFLKTIGGIEDRAGQLEAQCAAARELVRGRLQAAPDAQARRPLEERLTSLALTGALLAQTGAQARALAESYRGLEESLALAEKARGDARAVHLLEASNRARRLFLPGATLQSP